MKPFAIMSCFVLILVYSFIVRNTNIIQLKLTTYSYYTYPHIKATEDSP